MKWNTQELADFEWISERLSSAYICMFYFSVQTVFESSVISTDFYWILSSSKTNYAFIVCEDAEIVHVLFSRAVNEFGMIESSLCVCVCLFYERPKRDDDTSEYWIDGTVQRYGSLI